MGGYSPLKITGNQTGLVQDREEFILPNDAYPVLENAYVWRERILRKKGYQLLGRLCHIVSGALGVTDGAGHFTGNIRTILGLEATGEIDPGSVIITIGAQIFSDPSGNGILVGGGGGTINYITTQVDLQTNPVLAGIAVTVSLDFCPGLPVMGIRLRELNAINNEQTVFWDQKYAYINIAGNFQEFIPGFTWTGSDSDFFWTTNYWQSPFPANNKLFWETNFVPADGIRYTDGSTWITFSPFLNLANNQKLVTCLCLVPFRGRLVAFNTVESSSVAPVGQANFPQRIRWAAIGNPVSTISAIFPVGTINVQAWYDDVRGQGGFLDIPTSEQIVSVGFVRDNLVIFCERSTWQLRYTGRSIAPFQIEKVNSELGADSTFSSVQFDTSLVAVGDKAIVECDSFKSQQIDIKIPDLVFNFNNDANGPKRVQGVRDFPLRLAYWNYPYKPVNGIAGKYPNRRLVYNYENDSWAIFTDSLTALGTFQPQAGSTWGSTPYSWQDQTYKWILFPSQFPFIVGGNQQGFVEYLDIQESNDISLTITNITGNITTSTVINSPNHNLQSGDIIKIVDIPAGTPFSNLNGQIFQVQLVFPTPLNNFALWIYNPSTDAFDIPQLDAPGVYIGGGKIKIRDNFSVVSKKFNFIDEGQSIQIGYIDVLTNTTSKGGMQLRVYILYDDEASNILPQNVNPSSLLPDSFFNSVVPTSTPAQGNPGSNKYWQRVFCATRGTMITIQWTLSNSQMVGQEQESDVQIDAQVLWVRKAGRMTSI